MKSLDDKKAHVVAMHGQLEKEHVDEVSTSVDSIVEKIAEVVSPKKAVMTRLNGMKQGSLDGLETELVGTRKAMEHALHVSGEFEAEIEFQLSAQLEAAAIQKAETKARDNKNRYMACKLESLLSCSGWGSDLAKFLGWRWHASEPMDGPEGDTMDNTKVSIVIASASYTPSLCKRQAGKHENRLMSCA